MCTSAHYLNNIPLVVFTDTLATINTITMKQIETYIVDSFTDQPFKGNPAGVCLLQKELSENQMLSIAKELGFSETAFISKIDNKSNYSIRFFSPVMEIPLCGHATLASSKVIFQNESFEEINFHNIQKLQLNIKKEGEFIKMEFPIYNTIDATTPKELLDALGINEITNSEFNKETKILLIEIESPDILLNLNPNFEQLKKSHNSINGVLVTAKSNKEDFDFESRYFWPWSGTNEDPVTGGTHTFLAKYWSKRLNKTKMNSFQCSERTGFMEVELLSNEKMTIKGKAQLTLKGTMFI
jgi:PhzF family phenazine biosynthesis protein